MNDSFYARVYEIVGQVPRGKVTSYGRIAVLLGNPHAARAVGWAMRAAPEHLPCHRVVPATGRLSPGHFGGPEEWRRSLENEGVSFTPDGRIDMKRHMWP